MCNWGRMMNALVFDPLVHVRAHVCVCLSVFPPRAVCPGLSLADRVNANRSRMPQSPRLHQCPATASTTPSASFSFPLHRSLLAFFPSSFLCFGLFHSVLVKLLHLWLCLPGVSPPLSFDACDHSTLPAHHPLIFLITTPPPVLLL